MSFLERSTRAAPAHDSPVRVLGLATLIGVVVSSGCLRVTAGDGIASGAGAGAGASAGARDTAPAFAAVSPLLAAPPPRDAPGADSVEGTTRARIVARARAMSSHPSAEPEDAAPIEPEHEERIRSVAYVRDVLAAAGVSLAPLEPLGAGPAALEGLRAALRKRGSVYRDHLPWLGDLVFFRGTDAATTAGVTHVAIVVEVAPDGTVSALGWRAGTVRRDRLNPYHPNLRRLDGRIVNSYVRIIRRTDPPGTRYLAGELLDAFADAGVLVR